MFRFISYTLPLFILILLGFFLWRGLSINPQVLPSTLINHSAPAFNLPELQTPQNNLTTDIFHGHVSLLNVWATWCVVCADEQPILMEISQQYHIPIYGLDYKDERTAALQWLVRFGNPYEKIAVDINGTTAINWGVYGTPETFVIDQQGVIRYKVVGPITEDNWRQTVWPLIQKLDNRKVAKI
jgi:cytochrome c biogenesis protein CcmG/thiol:disulfide interchange protein DsbE